MRGIGLAIVAAILVLGLCVLSSATGAANNYLEGRGLATMTPFAGWPTATPRAVTP